LGKEQNSYFFSVRTKGFVNLAHNLLVVETTAN